MSQWIGYMVSVDCADKGVYQGEILSASNSQITLTKAFRDGIPCDSAETIVKAQDIVDLKLIEKQPCSAERSTITIAKPIAKRANRTYSSSENGNLNKSTCSNGPPNHPKSNPIDIEVKQSNELNFKSGTPNKKDRSKNKWNKGWKDEACFGSPLDDTINKDFDFEKNLALFNKQAVWDEINNSQKPDVVKHADQIRRQQQAKYRCDENVIASVPTTFRQITVPKENLSEYETDNGLLIPSITRSTRNKLFAAADKYGLTWERQTELLSRGATEISLQLVGGGHRLSPHNAHQWPTVAVLCGPNKRGAQGINVARQLTTHGVHTVVYIAFPDNNPWIQQELALYKLTRNKVITSVSSLPDIVDLIIVALCDDSEDRTMVRESLRDWVNSNRAPVLALDPPATGTPGIIAKYTVVPVLPLAHSPQNGRLYLCNLGFPVELFAEIGIKYVSPFGPKFVIPLHPSEES